MKKKIFIENLKCGGCESTIRRNLLKVEGVNSLDINVEECSIELDLESDISLKSALETLSALGYPQIGDSNNLLHKAKSYVSCAVGKINQ